MADSQQTVGMHILAVINIVFWLAGAVLCCGGISMGQVGNEAEMCVTPVIMVFRVRIRFFSFLIFRF